MRRKIISLSLTTVIIVALCSVSLLNYSFFGSDYAPIEVEQPTTETTLNPSSTLYIEPTTVYTESILNGQTVHKGDKITYSYEIKFDEAVDSTVGILHYNKDALKMTKISFPIIKHGDDFISDSSHAGQVKFASYILHPTTIEETTETTSRPEETTKEELAISNINTESTSQEETTEPPLNGFDFSQSSVLISAEFEVTADILGEIELYLEIVELTTYKNNVYVTKSEVKKSFTHFTDETATSVKHVPGETFITEESAAPSTIIETTQRDITVNPTEKEDNYIEKISTVKLYTGNPLMAGVMLVGLFGLVVVMLVIRKKLSGKNN